MRPSRIVCFSTADWDTLLPTNKHHLMRRLAARHRVLYVETLGTRAPRGGSQADWSRILRRLARGLEGPKRRLPNLWTISPLVRPRWSSPTDIALNCALWSATAGRHVGKALGEVVWVYNPYAIHLLRGVRPKALIYHLVDDLAAVPGADADAIRRAEASLLARADLVFCTERQLFDRARRTARDARFLPNVADEEHFANASPRGGPSATALSRVRAVPGPRLVFAGHLASHKVDIGLLDALVRRRPDWNLILIGPVWEADPERAAWQRLTQKRNVHAVGHVPYEELPPFLHAADVLLIPYADTEATRGVFPLKLFEYCATGRPIVGTAEVASLAPYGGAIRLAPNAPPDWETAIAEALRDGAQGADLRRELGRRHTWSARVQEMEAAVEQVLER